MLLSLLVQFVCECNSGTIVVSMCFQTVITAGVEVVLAALGFQLGPVSFQGQIFNHYSPSEVNFVICANENINLLVNM